MGKKKIKMDYQAPLSKSQLKLMKKQVKGKEIRNNSQADLPKQKLQSGGRIGLKHGGGAALRGISPILKK
jgi:hypothetical protein